MPPRDAPRDARYAFVALFQLRHAMLPLRMRHREVMLILLEMPPFTMIIFAFTLIISLFRLLTLVAFFLDIFADY